MSLRLHSREPPEGDLIVVSRRMADEMDAALHAWDHHPSLDP
jgi:hypothetical protein